MYTKGRLFRDKKYLNFIRSLPCLVTGRTDDTVIAHHVRLNLAAGIGIKPSDYRTVPLNSIEHRILHDTGEKSFWIKHNIDAEEVVMSQMLLYLSSTLSDSNTGVGLRCLEEALWRLRSVNQEID